ncbi:peptidylprolyl isomerase [Roseovarius salis]|uniref:peptidylprolyl isomerase n=1 Tax=Roseovarius salis TaxID=3376063 RepID=UPI0037C6E33B
MRAPIRQLLAAAAVVALAGAPVARAEDNAPDPDRVLATVDGEQITLAHVIEVRADLPQQYDQFPPQMLFRGILDQLIQQTLLMQSFDGELSRRSEVRLENDRRAVYANEVVAALSEGGIDEAELREAYEAQYPPVADELEYRAAHILVESEEEAQALVAELANGAEFAALAREESTGPSASVGGDLGWFGDGDMVAAFFDAVTGLEPGEVSGPVQTDFGWHVIKLNETREKQRPAFETVRPELEDQLRQQLIESHVNGLAETAEIDRSGSEDIDPAVIDEIQLLDD